MINFLRLENAWLQKANNADFAVPRGVKNRTCHDLHESLSNHAHAKLRTTTSDTDDRDGVVRLLNGPFMVFPAVVIRLNKAIRGVPPLDLVAFSARHLVLKAAHDR